MREPRWGPQHGGSQFPVIELTPCGTAMTQAMRGDRWMSEPQASSGVSSGWIASVHDRPTAPRLNSLRVTADSARALSASNPDNACSRADVAAGHSPPAMATTAICPDRRAGLFGRIRGFLVRAGRSNPGGPSLLRAWL